MIIRKATIEDSAGIAQVQVDSYKTAYAGIFPQVYLDQFTYEEQEQDWRELISTNTKDILFAAQSGGEIIGYALGRSEITEIPPYDCELIALHVLKSHQRHGVGSQLFAAMIKQFLASGCQALFLWTLAENPIRKFYENSGGQLLQEKQWDGNSHYQINVSEVAYGWMDLNLLLKNLEKRTRA